MISVLEKPRNVRSCSLGTLLLFREENYRRETSLHCASWAWVHCTAAEWYPRETSVSQPGHSYCFFSLRNWNHGLLPLLVHNLESCAPMDTEEDTGGHPLQRRSRYWKTVSICNSSQSWETSDPIIMGPLLWSTCEEMGMFSQWCLQTIHIRKTNRNMEDFK